MDMQAVWWKPRDVFISDTTFHPRPPFEPYNPFVHYHPHTLKQTTRSTKSLYYQFLQVDPEDQKAIAKFCCDYGMLGRLDNAGWIMWGMEKPGFADSLHIMGLNEPSPFGLLYEQDMRGTMLRQIAGIPPDPSLCIPMEWDDFRKVQGQLREATEWASTMASKRKPKEKGKAQTALHQRLRWKLSMVRPNVSRDNKKAKWRFTWDIGSLEAAFYLMLLSDVCGGGQIRNCELCGTFFLGITSRGRFCSNRCLNTFKVRRFRAKRKQRMSKQPASKEVLDGSSGR
ncbi:MAG: hypothetical protein NDI90_16110 [Nitrospira sp. BO4]|jgi:hypothetical protein|nr:hypothetical protein [Nitrospira sp. BO4]